MTVDLGQRIRALRAPGGLARHTQHELGNLIGADAISISRWERGEATPRPKYLRALAAVYEVPISYFYDEAVK